MVELQVLWSPTGQLCLWGSEEGRAVDAASLDRVSAQLSAELGRDGIAHDADPVRRVLDLSLPGRERTLAPVLVPGTDLLLAILSRVAEEDHLLVSEDEPALLATGLAAADSLRVVAQLDRLALELIAGGRMLPGLARSVGGWRAHWRAAPDEAMDGRRIALLAASMPGSLLAALPTPVASDAATQVAGAVLDHLIDLRVRRLLAPEGRRRRFDASRKTDSESAAIAGWLGALATSTGAIEEAGPSVSVLARKLRHWSLAVERKAPIPAGRDSAPAPGAAMKPRRLTVTLKATPAGGDPRPGDDGRLFALDGLCDFEWRVAVGDQRLTMAELRKLAAEQLPLIKSDGRWTVVTPEQVRHALETIERHGERGRAHAGELLRDSIALSSRPTEKRAPADPAPLGPPIELETDGWLRLLSGDADRDLTELAERAQPARLRGELRPYQRRGFAWLHLLSRLGLGACLADDMGLGKTIQLLALLQAERERNPHPSPTLLICPVSVVGNWQREARRFTPDLRVHVHYGPQRRRGAAFRATVSASDLIITSYSIVTRDRDLLGSIAWDRIALDEAQNIKSRRARQTQAIRSLTARHRIALTGTPVENRLTELHSIMDFLNPGLLGSADAFKLEIARPIEQWRDPDAAARLRQATAPFILRRLKNDKTIVPDLPEKIEMRTDCLLTKEQASLYQAVVDDLMAAADQPEGIARSGAILAALTRLKQVCNHPGALLGDDRGFAKRSGKLARLEEILEEALAEGDRALCFTQFSGFGQRLAWHLGSAFDREVLFLHGGSTRAERDEMVQRFQADDGPAIFVLSLRAGGTGLNLTAANQVIHFDRWWNPAVEDQATDRAYRIGQKRNVQVRKLTCVGTIEERIDTLLERKRDLAEMIVGSGESWITELDSAQLHELVALSPEAVELGDGEPAATAADRPSPDAPPYRAEGGALAA